VSAYHFVAARINRRSRPKETIDGNVSPLTNSFQYASRSSLFQPAIVLLFSCVSLECELLETAAGSN
jgi:hypothetical protein